MHLTSLPQSLSIFKKQMINKLSYRKMKYCPLLRLIVFFIYAIFLQLLPVPLQARVPLEAPTEAEIRLLPSYCKDTEWFPERYGEKRSYWIEQMGDSFRHLHHYCWARLSVNRARKANISSRERISLLESALHDYNYVTHKAPDSFILLPEIYTKVGELQLLRKQPSKADEAFTRARYLKPDYWPAYSGWVEYLITTGRRAEALDVVKAGLYNSPNAKVLLEQYRILGGKPSDIPSLANELKVPDAPTQ